MGDKFYLMTQMNNAAEESAKLGKQKCFPALSVRAHLDPFTCDLPFFSSGIRI